MTPEGALARLVEGNGRFASGRGAAVVSWTPALHEPLVEGQRPVAAVLGCSDSRVPAELVFDQGLGDLFVIRVAGNVVEPSQIGSVEFAAERLGAPLVVVLGHTGCSAIQAAVEAALDPGAAPPRGLFPIVSRVRTAIAPLLATRTGDRESLLRDAVGWNVRASVATLREGSETIRDLETQGCLLVVGAEYDIATGRVAFEERPASAPPARS
jgi:carbonic anhydrase